MPDLDITALAFQQLGVLSLKLFGGYLESPICLSDKTPVENRDSGDKTPDKARQHSMG
jgi:hypothetical protein